MVWRPVLHTRASTASDRRIGGGAVEQVGWIVRWPDVSFPDVEVELFPSCERTTVHMAWADRPTMFDGFIRCCETVARYSVHLRHAVIQRFTLWVEEDLVNEQLTSRGYVDGEVELLGMLRRLVNEAQLPEDAKCFSLAHSIQATRFDVDTDFASLCSLLHGRGWPVAYPPYKAQLKSIAWLQAVERATIEEQELCYNASVPLANSGWSYRITQDQLRPTAHSGLVSARIRGGCCCDAVGTGKTASALGLVLLSDPTPQSEKDGIRVRTSATLVIVPSNIPQQWCDEVAKFAPKLRVLQLLCSRDVKMLTIESLQQTDVVITTFATLRGKPYMDALEEHIRTIVPRRHGTRARDAAILCTCARALTHMPLDSKPPLVELIRWRRIIVDEVHEVLQSPRDMRIVSTLSTDTIIGLTGTPDTSCGEAVQAFYPFVLRPSRTDEEPHHNICLQAAVEHGLLCQNDELVTRPTHTIINVRLDSVERALLESLGRTVAAPDMVMLCCGVWGSNDAKTQTVSRDELVVAVTEWHKLQPIEDDEATRTLQEQRCAFVMKRVPDLLSYTECNICMQNEVDTLLLDCGHHMCRDCAESTSNMCDMCPFCRANVRQRYRVSPTMGSYGSRVHSTLKLLTHLHQLGEAVLVFSQFRGILLNVRKALQATSIRASLLEGSTARRAACVRRFRERELDALLMCFERSISGLNLSEACHVVMLHPLVGPIHEVVAMEEQAVGRAHRRGQMRKVVVHHLVAEHTHEEDLWYARHGMGAQHSLGERGI